MTGAMRMHMADRKTSLEETTAMSMQILPFWSLQWHTNVANILLLVYRSPNSVCIRKEISF
jgi:hypothetical protein